MRIALDVDRDFRHNALDGVRLDVVLIVAFRQLLELFLHASRAILLVCLAEALDCLIPVLFAKGREPLLADARRADAREVVAIPHLRHAVVHLRDRDDVRHIFVILLDLDARPVDGTFLEHVARRRRVRARNRVADVGLMSFRHGEKHELAVVEHGRDVRVVGMMRVAVIRRIVQEQIAGLDALGMIEARTHGEAHVRTVDGDALGERDDLAVAVADGSGKVVADAHQLRARRAHQRIRHLKTDAVETARENRHQIRFNRLAHEGYLLFMQENRMRDGLCARLVSCGHHKRTIVA